MVLLYNPSLNRQYTLPIYTMGGFTDDILTIKYKWRYTGDDTIMKHSPPEAPKKERWGTNSDTIVATYEATYAQTKNCNQGTTSERSVEKCIRG